MVHSVSSSLSHFSLLFVQGMQDRILNESEEATDGDFMIELEELWQDDAPMPTA